MERIRRVLEIAASTRVLRERRREVLRASRQGVVIGRHFLSLNGVAESCVAQTGTTVRALLDEAGFARLVRGCANAGGRLAALLSERPGLSRALAASLRDLYDAGVAPDALPDAEADLRAVYAALLQALERLRADGVYERVGLFRLALRGAHDWVARLGFAEIELHGATELVGSAGDLIEVLAGAAPLRMLQADWASSYAEELRKHWPWSFRPESSEIVDAPALARDGEIPDGVLRVLRAASPREEVEAVARELLRLLDAGVGPSQICVVARTLEPYAAWLESVFARHAIPFTSTLAEPLVRQPAGRLWLDLIDVLFGELERAATLRLLGSPRLRAAYGREAELTRLAERLSRRPGVVRGVADWRAALDEVERPGAAGAGRASPQTCAALRRALEEIAACVPPLLSARDFAQAGEQLIAAADRLLAPPDAAADVELDAQLRDALGRLALLDMADKAARARTRPDAAELRAALERAISSQTRRVHEADQGGVRLLDAVQARGVACDQLFLIGLSHGAWPRERSDDPFLSDSVREAVRERTGRPVPVVKRADAEERFMLGLLLSQARGRVWLSWPAHDAAGREVSPSTLLRNLPFVASDTSVIELAQAEPPPSDLLDASEALLRLARASDPGHAAPELLSFADELLPELRPALAAGLAQLAATERLTAATLEYDGKLAPEALRVPDRLSPSLIEALGQCPQRALFSRLLRVPELDALPPDALESRERGGFLHTVLARLYRALEQEGALRAGVLAAAALARARALLPDVVDASAADLRERLRERHPRVWQSVREQLIAAALDFVERDLETLLPEGVAELRVEEALEFAVKTPAGELAVRGTPDRLLRMSSGTLRMGDYKTRRDTSEFVSETGISRGAALQIPLYMLGSAQVLDTEEVEGEALSVPPRPERDRKAEREKRRVLGLKQVALLSERPLEVIGRLLAAGHFPFREDKHCRYCAYAIACRKSHAPSEERVRGAEAFADYFSLRGDGS